MARRYIPKPIPLVDVPPEPSEAELDAIAAMRPPPTPAELRSFERSVRILHLTAPPTSL
jgi:hypothetical protein